LRVTKKILLEAWEYCNASDPIKDKKSSTKYDPSQNKTVQKNALSLKYLKHGHDWGFVSFENDRIIINFQGSDDFFDWIGNIRAFFVRKNNMNKDDRSSSRDIHRGFYRAWKQFIEDVEKYINDYRFGFRQNATILIIGHSRGGSLGQLCSRHIAKNMGLKCQLITFGSPNVFGEDSAKEFSKLPIDYLRVEGQHDPVPKYPSKRLGFVKVGLLLKLSQSFWMRILKKSAHCKYKKTINRMG